MHRVAHAIVITLGASSLACAAVLETTLDVLATTTYTFVVSSSHPNVANFELYSTDRNVVWPGGGETYYLDDGGSDLHRHRLPRRGDGLLRGLGRR